MSSSSRERFSIASACCDSKIIPTRCRPGHCSKAESCKRGIIRGVAAYRGHDRRGTQCGNRVRQLASDGQRDRPVKRKRIGGGRPRPSGYVGCTGGAEARTEIIPEGNAEFLACFEQAEKAVAAITRDITASAATDLPLRDLTADVVFRPIGVEWNFGVIEHLQQFRLVGVQTLKQTVEYDETGLGLKMRSNLADRSALRFVDGAS
jgi:hypothetical protein